MMISAPSPSRCAPLLLGGLFIALAAPAFAQGTAEQREACTEDAIRLCPDAIPDVDRTTTCMKRHEAQLSRRCHRVFSAELNEERPGPRARRVERDLDGPRGGYAPRAGQGAAEGDDVAPQRVERRPIDPDDDYAVPRRAERYPAGPDGDDYAAPRRAERYPAGPGGDDYDTPRRAERGPYGPDGDDQGPRQAERLPPGAPYGEDGYGPRRYLYLAPQGRQVETPDDAY